MAGLQSIFDEKRNALLFDGECGLCRVAARFAERLDRARRFSLLPYQQISESELIRHGASGEKCSRRVYVLTARGKVFTGAFAVNYFLWHYYPWKIFVALIYIFPILLLLEIVGYAIIARFRRRLSQWLGLTACTLPFHPQTIRTTP